MKDLFEDNAPSLYVRLLCEELFREMMKYYPDITHIKLDVFKDDEA